MAPIIFNDNLIINDTNKSFIFRGASGGKYAH